MPEVASSEVTSENKLFKVPSTGNVDGGPPIDRLGLELLVPPERRKMICDAAIVIQIM